MITDIFEEPWPIILACNHIVGSIQSQMTAVVNICDDTSPLFMVFHHQPLRYSSILSVDWWLVHPMFVHIVRFIVDNTDSMCYY